MLFLFNFLKIWKIIGKLKKAGAAHPVPWGVCGGEARAVPYSLAIEGTGLIF
jgi:hypothetical protein